MAGFFPTAGTDAANTQNAARPVSTEEGCKPLFYRANCAPEFDPIATNALISEIINAINVVKKYDCSRLDNLADAFKYLGNICNLPTLAELGVEAVTNTDTLAGCFSELSGRITIADLRTVILDSMLCGLPTVSTAKETDFLAGCFDVSGAPTEAKISIGSLKALLGSGAPALIAGARFAQSSGPVFNNINVGNRQHLLIQGSSVSSGGLPGGPGRVGDFTFTNAFVTGGGTSDELVYYPISGNSGFGSAGSRAIANEVVPCHRVRDSWYAVHKGVATYIGAGSTLVAVSLVNFYEGTVL